MILPFFTFDNNTSSKIACVVSLYINVIPWFFSNDGCTRSQYHLVSCLIASLVCICACYRELIDYPSQDRAMSSVISTRSVVMFCPQDLHFQIDRCGTIQQAPEQFRAMPSDNNISNTFSGDVIPPGRTMKAHFQIDRCGTIYRVTE